MPYVKNLAIITSADGDVSMPFPWTKVPVDLNRGKGGLFIYIFKHMGNGCPPPGCAVTGVTVLEGENPTVPPGYVWDNIDISHGARPAFPKLAWTYSTNLRPLLDVHVVTGATRDDALANVPPGWEYVEKDLNEGFGGDFSYLIYRR